MSRKKAKLLAYLYINVKIILKLREKEEIIMKGKSFFGKILLLILFFSIISCSGGVDPTVQAKKDEQAQLKIAIDFLEQGDYETSQFYFKKLETELKYYKGEAIYGYTLSNIMKYVNDLADQLTVLLTSISGSMATGGTGIKNEEELKQFLTEAFNTQGNSTIVGSIISGYLYKFEEQFKKWNENLQKIEKIGHLDFKIDKIPIQILGINLMDLVGEHDMGEEYLMSAGMNLMLGWLFFFDSIDYNVDILNGDTLDYILNYTVPGFSDKNKKIAPLVIYTITYILNKNQSFLGLSENGAEKASTARDYFHYSYAYFAKAIRELRSEKDDQSDDFIAYEVDTEKNAEYAIFNITNLDLSTGSIPGADGVANISIKSSGQLKLFIGNDMDKKFDKIAANFTTGGEPISWANDIAPILSSIIVMVLKSGMLNDIINSAMSSDSSGMSDSLSSIINSDLIDESLVTDLLTGLIPDFIQIDFGSFYNNPPNYRDMFPVWTNGITKEVDDKFRENDVFLMEYECGDTTKSIFDSKGPMGPIMENSFVCNSVYSKIAYNDEDYRNYTIDSNHFDKNSWVWDRFLHYSTYVTKEEQGINFLPPIITAQTQNPEEQYIEITKDGIKSIIPYLYFPDSSFNGLLLIRMSPLNFTDTERGELSECETIWDTFGKPSNKCLNVALGKLLSGIISSLSLGDHLVISADK